MNSSLDIPYEFRASAFYDWVYISTANAVIGAQFVERVMNGICLMLNLEGLQFTIEDFMSGDASRTRQTLGAIERRLRKTDLFDPSFSERLQQFTTRRNRIVHGLFANCFKSHVDIHIDSQDAQDYVRECEWLAEEAAQLVEVGFGICGVVGNVVTQNYSNRSELAEIIRTFDEFHDHGLNAMHRKFRLRSES